MQQPGELARPALDNQPSIERGDVGCGSFGKAEFVRFRDDRRVARVHWLSAPPAHAGELPGDRGVRLWLSGHCISSLWWARPVRAVVVRRQGAGQDTRSVSPKGLDRLRYNRRSRAHALSGFV